MNGDNQEHYCSAGLPPTLLVKDQLIKKHLIFDCWFFLVTPSKMPYISIQNLESMNQKKLGK